MPLAVGCGDKSESEEDDDEDETTDDTGGEPVLDSDADGWGVIEDCDDTNPVVYPTAPELCDGLDNDCDDEVDDEDEDGVAEGEMYYPDADEDGYGQEIGGFLACEQPEGYVLDNTDCSDTTAAANPSLLEICGDDIDNDCDVYVDEDDASDAPVWYLDEDQDGYGVPDQSRTDCVQDEGWADNFDDCDDDDPAIFPEAPEYCDDQDNDCDALVDAEDSDVEGMKVFYVDADGDGHGTPDAYDIACSVGGGYSALKDDCDDANAAVNPKADEVCGGLDDDCDGAIDEEDSDLTDASDWYADTDADGYGDGGMALAACEQPEGYVADSADCDDQEPEINPAALEICDGVDRNCDGYTFCVTSLADAEAKLTGEADNDRAGYALDGAGDVDGDGAADLVVGAYQSDLGASNGGAAYVLYGAGLAGGSLSGADAALTGGAENDYAGFAVAGAGDVNGDEYDDVLVGAYQADLGGDGSGAAYVAYGPLSGTLSLSSAAIAYSGAAEDDRAGAAVAGAGDVNDDGYADFLVGAYQESSAGSDAGAAYLLYGPAAGGSLADALAFTGASSGDQAGVAVAGLGDVNDDGYADVGVGADGASGGSGAFYLFYGPVDGGMSVGDADAWRSGEAVSDYAGSALDGAGDVNDDGYDDVVVGAYGNDAAGSSAGAAYLLYGPLSGTGSLADSDAILWGEAAEDRAGTSVSGVGDIDLDGYDDLVVGAYGDDTAGGTAGSAYVLYGPLEGSGLLSLAVVKLLGEKDFDYAGYAVAGAGDVDEDGSPDVLVGAYQEDSGGSNAGAAYLVLGQGW